MLNHILLLTAIILLASCGRGDNQSSLDGGPAGLAPTISVDGSEVGLQPVAVEVEENSLEVALITSSAGLSLSLDNDGSLFTLDDNGQLSFIEAPDFENPSGDGSNSYTLRVDATAGSLSSAVTLSITVTDAFEGIVINGRVVDGPVAGAAVFVDLNCNKLQDSEEPVGVTDSQGFFALESEVVAVEGCSPKFFSTGGTDIATGKPLENIVLQADLPKDPTQKVAITPLTTIIAQAASEEDKQAVVAALGLGDTSVEDILTTDAWGTADGSQTANNDGSAVTEEDKKRAEAIQRVNSQVATVIKVAASVASTAQSGAGSASSTVTAVEAVAKSIVAKSVEAATESAATGVEVKVDITDAAVIEAVIEETVTEVVIVEAVEKAAADAEAAGEDVEAAKAEAQAAAETVAVIKVAQVKAVTSSAAAAVESVNTAAADVSINPTSTQGLALAQATETTVVQNVDTIVGEVKTAIAVATEELGEGASDEALAEAVSVSVIAVAEVAVVENAVSTEDIFNEVVSVVEEIKGEDEVVTFDDFDGDGISDLLDSDDDNDGVNDGSDAFPKDRNETTDTDQDGIGNNEDSDDDGDGVADALDELPLNAAETLDTDGDGVGNNLDTDDDGDGVADTVDAFPLDKDESIDTDGDGTGDAADTDDDGDGVADTVDAFPLDKDESADTDGDGTGDAADADDDGDGVADDKDAFPLVGLGGLSDTDGDGYPNSCDADCLETGMIADADDDNDGVLDEADQYPLI
ncbi:MAG: thrombospondin type 3 repeat-containing protein, partial [Pseudomonadales bacterium]